MSVQRGNFHQPGHLRQGGQTPHFFEIGEKSEKPHQTHHLQSEATRMYLGKDADHHTECRNWTSFL